MPIPEPARLDGAVVGPALAVFLAFGYLACVGYDLAFGQEMYRAWIVLLPGVEWISWGSFLLGLLEVIVYGLFAGLVFAPLYNLFALLQARRLAARTREAG